MPLRYPAPDPNYTVRATTQSQGRTRNSCTRFALTLHALH